jgi:uncharacterized membrane protein
VMEGFGIRLQPIELAVWEIPTAIAAILIHSTRLLLLDRSLARRGKAKPLETPPAAPGSGE